MAEAIFTEVLQIGIDTTKFAASMREVEQIYANSIKNMPELASVGNVNLGAQMQQVAAQFNKAAAEIGSASKSITEDVAIMVHQSNANMEAMAEKTKTASAEAAHSLHSNMSFMEKFGAQLSRQLVHLPAMALVASAMYGAFEAVKAPFEFLIDGLHNLQGQSEEFQNLRLETTNTLSTLQSIAATPVFNLLLEQMEKLTEWLKENRVYVENIALSFGNMAASFLEMLIDFAKMDIIKDGFKGLAAILIVTAATVGDLVLGLKTVLGLASAINTDFSNKDQGDGTVKGWFKAVSNNTKQLFDGGKLDSVLANLAKEKKDLDDATAKALASISGGGMHDESPDITPRTKFQDRHEVVAEFRLKLSDIRTHTNDLLRDVDKQVADQVINLSQAAVKKTTLLNKEEKEIDSLVDKYKKLAVSAVRREDQSFLIENPRKVEQEVRAVQDMIERGSMSGQGSYKEAIHKQLLKADEDGIKERATNRRNDIIAEYKLREEAAAAAVALVKKEVAEGHMTRQAGVEADIALEKLRFESSQYEIGSRPGAAGSVEAGNRQNALNADLQKHNERDEVLSRALVQAKKEDVATTDALYAATIKNNIALKEEADKQAVALGHKREHIALTREIIKLKLAEAAIALKVAQEHQDTLAAGTEGYGKDAKTILDLQAKIKQLEDQLHNQTQSGSALGHLEAGDQQSLGQTLKDSLHLDVAIDDWKAANNGLEKFAAALEGAVGVLKGLAGAVSGAVSAYKSGGALGAAGSLLQNSSVTSGLGKLVGEASKSVGNMVPVVGPMIGQAFGMISSLFMAGIQKMVNAIHDKIDKINQEAQLGQITLSEQITALQNEKADIQKQLSGLGKKKGKKGGTDELKSILKQLDFEIAQLQKQQKEIITNFNHMVKAMSLGTSVMTDWYNTWVQINQQVKTYIDAGGSLATAAQFLNMSLQQQRQKLQESLNQGEQTAISDAIQLNDLLKKRVQMMKDEAATEFGMLNADSMERRTSNAVKLGTELQKQRAQYAEQLADTNNQISLEQRKVAAEGKIFDINKSLAELREASNRMTLESLDQQLAKYKDMQKLLAETANLTYGPKSLNPKAGWDPPIPGEPTISGPVTIGTVSVTIGSGSTLTKQQAGEIGTEIGRGIRSGRIS